MKKQFDDIIAACIGDGKLLHHLSLIVDDAMDQSEITDRPHISAR